MVEVKSSRIDIRFVAANTPTRLCHVSSKPSRPCYTQESFIKGVFPRWPQTRTPLPPSHTAGPLPVHMIAHSTLLLPSLLRYLLLYFLSITFYYCFESHRVQVATRLGKEAASCVPRGESSPLRRKIKTFGKAVVAAMSREASCSSDTGSKDEGGKGGGRASHDEPEAWGVLPQSPLRVKAKANADAGMGDDFGVELGDLSW